MCWTHIVFVALKRPLAHKFEDRKFRFQIYNWEKVGVWLDRLIKGKLLLCKKTKKSIKDMELQIKSAIVCDFDIL